MDGCHFFLAFLPRVLYVNKYIGIKREEEDLKNGVKGHEPCTVFSVTGGQVIPDDNHGYTAGQPDQYEPHHVFVMTRKEGDGQQKHQDGANDPVLDE